jgi:predicted PurR-regulated permease PerM
MPTKVEISYKTILFTVAVILGLWLLYVIRDVLFLVFISFILMTALRPMVDWLAKIRIPRVLSILVIYGLVFGLFGGVIASTVPSLIFQSTTLVQALPQIVERLAPTLNIDVQSFTQQIAPISENVVRVTFGIFSNIFTLLTVLSFTFYFLLERRNTETFLKSIMSDDMASGIISVVRSVEEKLGAWVRGQLILMFVIGLLVFVGLSLLHVEFALPLAILAALLEIVPIVGPILSAIPAVLLALATSPILAVSVVALYFVVQQVENNIVVPMVIRRSVGLSPIITIFSLLVGARLAGIVGAILAVPIFLVLQVILNAILTRPAGNKKPLKS